MDLLVPQPRPKELSLIHISKVPGVGNNPFCIAIPRKSGPIVLDMAMSQYAYGKLGVYRLAGKQLPFPGGFDKDGNLTRDVYKRQAGSHTASAWPRAGPT